MKSEKIKSKKKLSSLDKELGLKETKPKTKSSKKDNTSERKKIIKDIVKSLNEKKCEDIIALNLENVNSYLSIFVIATVATSTQAKSVVRELEKKTKHLKMGAGSLEKKNSPEESGWAILDLGEIILHVMTKEVRAYYDLDKLWGDAEKIKI